MNKYDFIMYKILSGEHDNNIAVCQIGNLFQKSGFEQNISGSIHNFYINKLKESIKIKADTLYADPDTVIYLRNFFNTHNIKDLSGLKNIAN